MKAYHNELEYLIAAIKEMRRLRREEGYAKAQAFQRKMEEYFRLPPDFISPFIYDTLLRLERTPAGTSGAEPDDLLTKLHTLKKGDVFYLHGRKCVFLHHTAARDDPTEGFFEYTYDESPIHYRTLDYYDAWTFMREGSMYV